MPDQTGHTSSALSAAMGVPLTKLTPFEGKDVISCAIEIPGAAGGLREALKFDPVEIQHDEERVLVMKVKCKKVRFDEVKDTDALRRVMVLEPVDDLTAFIDEDLVREQLSAQAERIRLAREKAAGVERLPMDGDLGDLTDDLTDDERDEREAMVVQHNSGVHRDGLRDECPLCQEERQAEEDETGGGDPVPIGKAKPGGRKRTTGSK